MTKLSEQPKKIVLAYSGGLDTSVILKWLQNQYECEVITYTANLGQNENLSEIKKKAKKLGINQIFLEDLTEDFARDYIFPMFRCNAIYEGEYLLGTSIARPLIAKRLVEIADETGAEAIAHGSTGKGNDQVRFELGAYALNPKIKVITPWRIWDFKSRNDLIDYAEKYNIPLSEGSKKNRHIQQTLIFCTFHMRVEIWKILGKPLRMKCGNGQIHQKVRPILLDKLL